MIEIKTNGWIHSHNSHIESITTCKELTTAAMDGTLPEHGVDSALIFEESTDERVADGNDTSKETKNDNDDDDKDKDDEDNDEDNDEDSDKNSDEDNDEDSHEDSNDDDDNDDSADFYFGSDGEGEIEIEKDRILGMVKHVVGKKHNRAEDDDNDAGDNSEDDDEDEDDENKDVDEEDDGSGGDDDCRREDSEVADVCHENTKGVKKRKLLREQIVVGVHGDGSRDVTRWKNVVMTPSVKKILEKDLESWKPSVAFMVSDDTLFVLSIRIVLTIVGFCYYVSYRR